MILTQGCTVYRENFDPVLLSPSDSRASLKLGEYKYVQCINFHDCVSKLDGGQIQDGIRAKICYVSALLLDLFF